MFLRAQRDHSLFVWQLLLLKSEHACVHRSFGEETTGGVEKCWLFSQADLTAVLKHHKMVRKDKKDLKKPLNGHLCKVDTSGTNQKKFQWHFFNWKKFPINSDQSNLSCFDQNSGYFKISVLWDWFWFNQSRQSGPPSDMTATFSRKCIYSDQSVPPKF